MVERRAQSFDKDDLLAEMEALIRNGVRIDVPQAVNKHLEEYEEMTPDEREFDRVRVSYGIDSRGFVH